MNFKNVDASNYNQFYSKTQEMIIGPMLLPIKWKDELWGLLMYQDEVLVGGWIGNKRIKHSFISKIYQEVVFHSQPQLFVAVNQEDIDLLVDSLIEKAKQENISCLSISHWSRENIINSVYLNKEINATYIIDLEDENLYKNIESSQRQKIKKAEKKNVLFKIVDVNNYDKGVVDFDFIRQETQDRALKHDKNSSITLKSTQYYKMILDEYRSKLISVTYEDKIAGMLLIIESGRTIYPYYSGSDIYLNRETGANAFMRWKLFEYGKANNFKYIDMGGVPVNPTKEHPAYGVYQFKKSFGGQYHEYVHGDIIINTFRYGCFNYIKTNNTIRRLISKKI